MNRTPIEKSMSVASAGYDEDAGQIEIELHGGRVYRYTVPRETFDELMAAESKGRFFQEHLRHLPSTRVDEEFEVE